MAAIPDNTLLVTHALFKRSEETQRDSRRQHLGASEVNEECERKIWYAFRWAQNVKREGRMVRLLRRGDQEEQQLRQDLRELGYELRPGTAGAFVNGHFGGTPDGFIRGIPEAPETWHVLELKTSNEDRWLKLLKLGVEQACPEHYAQMQIYMLAHGLERALYLSVNKDDDRIYEERVYLNRVAAQRYIDRARRVIERQTLPERISDNPGWFQCKPCKWNKLCHEPVFPDRTCRTCLHVTVQTADGTPEGGWFCTKHLRQLDEDAQKAGCIDQLFLPSLLHWLEQVDATDSSVVYSGDGIRWTDHGPTGAP